MICFSSKEEKGLKKNGFKNVYYLSEKGDLEEAGRNYFSTLRRADESPFNNIYCLLIKKSVSLKIFTIRQIFFYLLVLKK